MVGWPWPTSRRRERGEAWWSGKEKISVILPTLNEERSVERSVRSCLGKTKGRGTNVEVVVVDGGSRDDTVRRARRAGARVVSAERGRGLQQDVGSKAASGDLILFLHADSELPEGYDALLHDTVRKASRERQRSEVWGAFAELRIRSKGPLLRVVEFGVKQRTKLLHKPYGDQCLFFHRDAYESCGGFKRVPFMEDYDVVHRQRRRGIPPILLDGRVTTSGRRWKERGVLPVFLLNQALILSWHLGISPQALKELYYKGKPPKGACR